MAHRFQHSEVMDTYQSAILSYSGDAISADSIWLDLPEKQRAQARPEFIYDARVVTADYLINNIEQAFQAWQDAPWSERIDFSTFFRMSYQPGIPDKGYWFGYDLGEDNDYLFAGVGFCPNSDQNMIEPGDLYELFYFKDQWISLGQQMASNNHLIYDNAPVGALLWLRNLTKGKEERVFTYENKKQIWW